ncbi:MAG: 16S rRNA (cytosine(967)-C(5))-methyltransferase RsmB, partial [Clostridiales bacterium]|nr:16S rRNA (cytosine(967)-C(5))-methyltransferase RsmB [Clostridiales bacterium]
DAALKDEKTDRAESALISALVYTTLERLITIDYELSLYLKQPIKKLRPEVLTALRMGCCQLFFMDRIPVSAAVNESVKAVKNNGCAFAAGLVNAVLRKASNNGLVLPDVSFPEYKSVKYSVPMWLMSLWENAYGKDGAEKIMAASLGKKDTFIRVNTLKTTPDELIERLSAEGVKAEKCSFPENALRINMSGSIEGLKAYSDGLFHVQDISSQVCAGLLGARAGDTVFDMCSAPGGKAFTIAESMGGEGEIKAFDIYEKRLGLVSSGAKRLGINIIKPEVNDASVFNESVGKADKILCDVPCSGLGVIGRKPEIRYKMIEDIDKLPDLQYAILCQSIKYLKMGGIIIYSTCSLNPAENDEVCLRFLKEHPSFKAVKLQADCETLKSDNGFLTFMPQVNGSDGFFTAAFKECETE